MDTKVMKTKKLIPRPETEIDVSDLLMQHTPKHEGKFIEEVELKPSEQARVVLGVFKSSEMPEGFSVALSPQTVEGEEIIKQITKLELQDERYELILHIANYSSNVVSAEVWRLA